MGANNKQTYHKRKKEGLCPNCGSFKIEEGKTYCKDCVEVISQINKLRVERYISSGRCRLCGEHLTDEDVFKNGKKKSTCKSCRTYRKKYNKVVGKNE